MDLDRAKEIVQALADGVDPYTGERFPADGPYQRADTVRALYKILEAADSGKKPKDPTKPRAGGRWTQEEEQKLRDEFQQNVPFEQIAKDHGRTRGAITARLVKLGLIEDPRENGQHPTSGQGNSPEPSQSNTSPHENSDLPF
jgi:hypothetical protein